MLKTGAVLTAINAELQIKKYGMECYLFSFFLEEYAWSKRCPCYHC